MKEAIFFVAIWFSLVGYCYSTPKKPYYWTTRKFICNTIHGHDVSRCALHMSDRKVELNPGCHEELKEVAENNQTRIYCRIMCEESNDITILNKIPTWNHVCNIFYNYQLERHREDWYLWRSGDCLNTTITFEIRCGFARDPRIFYRENTKLFEYDDAVDDRNNKIKKIKTRN
ncbi:unnamed protein product [Dracunculus medinensis]|uniref:Conserved secreted protein n=1 Tax=Dracunculus medinensis TaxID=318479 RepID=A0A0N4U455_DRAME|nr:unnamed protein product [Dracunculus medinensis]